MNQRKSANQKIANEILSFIKTFKIRLISFHQNNVTFTYLIVHFDFSTIDFIFDSF